MNKFLTAIVLAVSFCIMTTPVEARGRIRNIVHKIVHPFHHSVNTNTSSGHANSVVVPKSADCACGPNCSCQFPGQCGDSNCVAPNRSVTPKPVPFPPKSKSVQVPESNQSRVVTPRQVTVPTVENVQVPVSQPVYRPVYRSFSRSC